MKARTIELSSPAKVNLFLDVLGERNDGYHDIVTVFEKIDLCDNIRLEEAEDGITIRSNLKELPCGENNLVYRAYSLLKNRYGVSGGVKVHIEKNIPVAAGLGGGSSNAAAALKGLSELWGLGLGVSELCGIGAQIGADVPFFIFNDSFAVGRGRGDEIQPIKSALEMWHVVISPPVHVLTKDIYNNPSLRLTGERPDVKMIVRAIQQKDAAGIKKLLYNALEPVVSEKVTEIFMVKDFLKKRGFDAAIVSGSGPTIFLLAQRRKEAAALQEDLLNSFIRDVSVAGWNIFVAKTLSKYY